MSSPDQSPAINSIGPSVPTLLPVLGGLTASGLPLIQNLSCACIKDKKCQEREEEKEEERLLILFGGLTADGLPLVQNLVHSRAPLLSPTNVILTVIQQEEENNKVKEEEEEVLQEVSTKEGAATKEEISTKEGESVLQEVLPKEGESVLLEVSTKEGESVLLEVSTKEGESVLPEVSTKEGESVLLEASTEEGESVLQEVLPKEGESVLLEVSTKEGESVLLEVSTKEGESVLQKVSTEEGESVLQEVPTKEGESVLLEAPTKEGESVLPEVSTKEGESVLLEAPTKEGESVLQEVSTKEGESLLLEAESTEQNQPGAPELSNTSIEKSIAPVVDFVEQKVEAKEPHDLVESAPLETPITQEHTETVPKFISPVDKTRLEKLEQLENDLKQAFLPTQDVPTKNNHPLQTSRPSDEAFLTNFLRQLAHFKMTDEEKYADVVERLRQLEDELKISSSGLPPDPEFSELVGRILKSDYPNADLQIIVNSSRKTTTTKSFYETETPGMVGLNGDQIRELQVKLMGNISSPENAANQPDTTVPSDAVQRREVAEEGYAAPDGSEVVSKKMTRVVTTSQSTVSGLDEHPEAARDDIETVSIASTGSVRDRIAIFEAINEKLKHEKEPQPVHKITSEEITHPKAPITETTITETTIEKRYAEEERPVAPERVTIRETREVYHETMPEPTRETIETVIHEVHYTQPEEHAISPEPVEETYVEESFAHEIIPSEVQAHVEAKPYIEEIKPTETHLFKADEVPQRPERYADRFEQKPTYQIEEEISQESEAIRRSPVREIEEVIEKEPVVEEQVEVPIEVEKRVASFQVGTPEHVPEERHGEERSPSEPELAIEHIYTIDEKEEEPVLAHKEPYPEQFEEEIPAEGHEHAEERHMESIEEKHPEAIVKTPSHELPASFEGPEEQTSVIISEERTYIRTLPSEVEEYPEAQFELNVTTQEKIPEHPDDVHAHAEERHIEAIEEKHPEAIVRTPSHELPASFEEPEEQKSVIVSEERTYIRTLPSEVEEYPEAQLNVTAQAYPEEKIPEHLDDVHEHAEERHMEPIEEKHPESIVKTPSHEISASFEEPEEQRSVIVSEERTYIRTLPSEVEEYPAAQFEDEIDEKHVIDKEIPIEKHEAVASPTSYEQEYRYEREYSEEHDETGGISVPKMVAGAVVLGAMTIGEKIKSAVSGIGKGEEEEHGYEETKKESPSAEERTSYEERFPDQESPLEEHVSRVRESPVEEHDEYKHEERIEEAPIQTSHGEHPSELEELSREPIEESPEIFRESPIQEHIVTAESLVEEHRSEFLKEEHPSELESQEILSPLEEKFGREEIKESPLEEIPSEPIQGSLEEEQLPKESHTEEISMSEQYEYPSEPIQEYHRELAQEKEYPEESPVEEIPSEPIQDQHHRELVQEKEYPEVSPVEEIPSEPIQKELPRVEEPESIQEKHESPEPQESPIEQEPSEMAQNFPHEPTLESPEEESYVLTESQLIEAQESPSEIPQPDPEKVTIKNADKPFILRRIANISIFTGPGDLTAELIDSEGLPVKVELVKVSPEDYNLSFLPVKLGTYELNLFLSGLQVPVTPTSITVEEQGKPYLYGSALDYGVEENQPVSLIFDPKESKGGIKIDVRSPSGEKVRHTTDRRSDGSTEILFLPTQPGKHLVSVDFNNRPIYGSPYQVTVFEVEKVGGVEEEPVDQLTKISTGTEFEPEEPVTKVELEHDVYPAGYEQRYQHETYEVYSEESQPRHEISIEEPEEEKSVIVSEERAYIRTLPTQIEELAQREPEIPQHEIPFEEREATHPPSYEQEYRHETLEHEYPDESGISVPKMVAGAVVLGAMAIGEKVKSAVTGLGRGERETLGYEEEPETIGGQHYIGQEVIDEERVAREHLEEEPEYPIQPDETRENVLLEDLPSQEQWQYEYKEEEEKPISPRGSPIREMEDQIEREFELHEEKYQMVESDSIPTAMDDKGKIDQEPVQESRLEEAPVEVKIEITESEPSQREGYHTELAPESPTTSEEERDKIEAEYVTEKIRHSIEEISEPAIVKESTEIVTSPGEEEVEQESETVVEERKPETEIVESEEVPSYIPAESKMEPDGQFVLTDSYTAEDSRPIEETTYYSSETEVVQSEEVPIHMPEEAKYEPEGQYEESSPAYGITETDSYTAEERRPIEEVEQYPSEPERISKRLVEEVLVELKLGEEAPTGLAPEETEHGLVESEEVAEPEDYQLSPKHKFEAEKEHPEEPELVQVQLESPAVVTCEYHVVESEEVPTGNQIETTIKTSSKELFHETPDSKISREPEHYEESSITETYEIARKPQEQQQEYEAYPAGYDQEYQYREDFPEESGISVPKMVAGAMVLGAMAIGEKVKSAVSGIGKRGDSYGYEAVSTEDGEGEFPEERTTRISEREPMLSYEEEKAEEVPPRRSEIFSDEQHKAVPYEAEVLRNEYQIIESEEIPSEHLHEEPRFDQEAIVHEPGFDQEAIVHEDKVLFEPELVESEEVPSVEHEIRFEPEAHATHEETLIEQESFEPELVESEEVPPVEHEIRIEPEAASHATHERHEETLIEKESFEPELVESEEVPPVEHEIRFEPDASHATHEETLVDKELFEPELVESEEVPSVEHEIKFEQEPSHATHEEHVPAATPESEKFQTEFVESEEVDTEQPTPSGMPFTDFNENEQFIETEEFKTKESALRDARLDESITEKESIVEDQEAIEHELVESETVEDVDQIPSSRLETDELEKREEEERPVHETEVKTIPTVEYQLVESESYTIEPNVEQKIESPIHETVPEGRTPEKDEVTILVTEDIPTEGKYEEEIIICESPVGRYLPSEEEEPISEKQPTTPESPSRSYEEQYQMVESESVPLAIQHEPKFEPDSIQETPHGNYEQEYQEESGISVPKMVAGAIVLGAMSIGEKVKEAVSGIGKSAEYETETFVTEYRPTGSPEFPEESDYEHETGAPEEHHIEPSKLVEEEYHVEPTKLEEEHHMHESHILPLSPKEVSDRLEKEIIEESLEKSYVEEEEMVESQEIPGERYIETIFEPEVAHPVTPIPIEEQGGEKPIEEDTKVDILPEEYVESEEIKHGFEPQAHEQISRISIEETESGYLVESEEVPKESQFVEPKFEAELPSTKESFEEITAPEGYLREEIIESEEVPSGEAPEAVIRQYEELSPETKQRYEKESLESPEDQLTPEKETLVVSEYEVVESEEVPGEESLEEPKFEQAPRKSLESEDLTTSRTTSDEPRVSRQESVERRPTEEIEKVEIEEYSPEHPESGELRHEIETTSEPSEEFFEEEKQTRTTIEQEAKLEPEDFEQKQAYEPESSLLTEYHLVESEELPAAHISEPSFEPEISEKRESSYEEEMPHGITEAVAPGFPEQVVEKVEERITPDQQLLEEYDVVESEEIPQEAQEHPKLSVATAPVEEYDYPEEPIPSGEEDQSGKVPYTVSADSVYQEPTEAVHRTYEEEEYPEESEDSMSVPKMVAGAVVLGAMAIGERVKSAVSSLGKSEEGGGSYQEIDERLSAREEFEHGEVPSQHERQFEDLKLETGQVSHEEEKSPTISEHLSDKTIVLRETSETSFEDLQVEAPEDLLEMHGREETPEHEKEHEPSTPMVEHEHAARESPFQELHAPTPEDLLAIHDKEEKDEYEIIESEEIPQAKFVPEAHRESPREVTPEELRVSTPEDLLEMHEGERHEHPGGRQEHPVIDSEESPKHEPEILLETSEEPIEGTQLRPTSGLSYEELEEVQRKSPIEEELSVIQAKSEEIVDAALLKVLTEEEPQESTSPFEIVESEDEALPQGDVPPAYDRLESIEAELQPTQLVASGGLGVTELPSRPKSPVPPRFFQEPEAEPALESHEVDVVMETSLEKFETDSLNEDSGSPETTAAPTKGQKHVSTDNLSEGSLQEFERLELELVRRDGSPSSIEAEIEKNGAGSIAGSINSLTEFENLEREIQETVPDEAMMLSDICEEEEAEVMSIREDDEEDENADSLRETRVVDPMLVSYYGGEPMITSVDSLELAAHQQHLGMEISLDSLGASNQNYITDKDSLLEGATSQENPSQDTQVLTGDTMGTYQEYQDEDDRDSLNEVIDSYPTTLTTFETVQVLDDGTAAQIIRRVQTRVTDPVHSHVRFTGTEDEAHLRSLPFDETVETVDEEGNITITTRKRAFS